MKKHHPLSRRRRLFFCGAALALILVTAELGSWIALSLLERAPATYGRIAAEAALVAGETKAGGAEEREIPQFLGRIIHPYLGFVVTPREINNTRTHGEEQLEQYGYDVGSGPLVRERREDTVVIGIFGGSVAKQFWERQGTVPMIQELQKYPRFKDKNIVISSGAFYSYRQPQHLLSLSYLLTLGAKFDVVLLIDGFNEAFRPHPENINEQVSPFYPYGWYFHMQSMHPDPTLQLMIGKVAVLRESRHSLAQSLLNGPLRFSMLASFLWKVMDRRVESAISTQQKTLQDYRGEEHLDYTVTGPVPHYDSEEAYTQDLAGIWKEGARQMYYLAKGNGAEFLHVLQPNQYAPGAKIIAPEEEELMQNADHRAAVELGFPAMREAGKDLQRTDGAHFADFSTLFRNVSEPLLVDDCCHFNTRGNELLGTALGKLIGDAIGGGSPGR